MSFSAASALGADTQWRFEVKRQNTDRDTPGESTKTTLRLEALPDGPVALWRLDLPFPDQKDTFSGSPFDPRLGDIKLRGRLRPTDLSGVPVSLFSELTFPTADPDTLGQGKYQVMLGAETFHPLPSISNDDHKLSFSPQVQQVFSVAGNPERKDINYTKFEVALRDVWRKLYSLKFTAKPVIDWVQNGKTGAVGELEGAVALQHDWKLQLMLGGLLWGEGTASTYGTRVELTVGKTF
ncbi:MAG TPA: hypothetical protein VGF58_17195 [Burkholderiales bacterium]